MYLRLSSLMAESNSAMRNSLASVVFEMSEMSIIPAAPKAARDPLTVLEPLQVPAVRIHPSTLVDPAADGKHHAFLIIKRRLGDSLRTLVLRPSSLFCQLVAKSK
jgi:hypothetical protein